MLTLIDEKKVESKDEIDSGCSLDGYEAEDDNAKLWFSPDSEQCFQDYLGCSDILEKNSEDLFNPDMVVVNGYTINPESMSLHPISNSGFELMLWSTETKAIYLSNRGQLRDHM